ncbi:MAG TPA: Glu/Leu/Phe/Val dehydrogenase dimerization domain-containing protein [Microbacteriaceae bacterium]|nr:Glu/Leu/Phe/Val dehydrogenase dimerization domain-containing protein [Microbacteriaceae bacterium]
MTAPADTTAPITGMAGYADHDAIHLHRLLTSGKLLIVAEHLIRGGHAMGGCRVTTYANEGAAIEDALRLSEAMTKKIVLAGLPYGGGKAVVMADPATDKDATMLREVAEFVDRLGGSYVTAPDVGLVPADMVELRKHSEWVVGLDPTASYYTSVGVVAAVRAVAEWQLGTSDLSGVRATVQGLGNVGYDAARLLAEAGAAVTVADPRADVAARAAAEFGAVVVGPDEIVGIETDFFVPCALGGVINAGNVDTLPARFVVGGANNQLADPTLAARLHARGVLYAPDYLVNAGGVIGGAQELVGFDEGIVRERAEGIGPAVVAVLRRAEELGIDPLQAAELELRERLAAEAAA